MLSAVCCPCLLHVTHMDIAGDYENKPLTKIGFARSLLTRWLNTSVACAQQNRIMPGYRRRQARETTDDVLLCWQTEQ